MKIPNYQYRCPLGRLQPQTTDLDAIKERGWRDQHILVVSETLADHLNGHDKPPRN